MTERDLWRFREYETYIGMIYSMPVTTLALCTLDVEILKWERMGGNNIYRIESIRLKDGNTDKVFQKSERKIRKEERLKRRDVFSLPLTPLMSGTMEISERICRGMDILENPGLDMKEEDVRRMQSMLYALAIKFLDRNQLMDIKEKIRMTILGQMLFENERKKRMKRGGKQGIQR